MAARKTPWTRKKPRPLGDLAKEATAILQAAAAEIGDEARPDKTAPAQWSEKDKRRATIRSACVAAHQRYSRSGNPLHVWQAIWMCTGPNIAPMKLPEWCIEYLHSAADSLLRASGKGDPLAASITQAFKLTRPGWNAFKALDSAAQAITASLTYDEFRLNGMSSNEAYEKVRTDRGLEDTASARTSD